MRRRRRLGAVALLALVAASCGGTTSPSPDTAGSPTAGPSAQPTAGPTATPPATPPPSPPPTATPAPTESLTEAFDPVAFTNPTAITNPWLPLVPGTRWVHEGRAIIDGEEVRRRVVLIITDLTKTIAGVRAVVGYELDYDEGVLVEREIALWAQDDAGTVWHLGQFPEVYEDGVVVETPIWIHGLEGANAGITMKASPSLSAPSYSMGWGPAVGWNDRARVFEMGSETCVPAGCYADVLVTDEFSRDEPDAHQLKYYARGVGNVRVGWAGAREAEQEVLELVERTRLGPDELARVREDVLAQEARGYASSPDVYGKTAPAEPGSPT
jgi:hypothetical protein